MTTRTNVALLVFASAYFLLAWLPGVVGPSGYFIDEFYYLTCAERLAFGYVDHPPLSIFLLRLVTSALGDSVAAVRLVPALAGATTVFVTGIIARRLGATTLGQLLAAGAVMAVGPYQVMFSFFSMNSLSLLIWALCFLTLVEIERREDARLWLVFGLLVGIGLENKHTIVLLAGALAGGMLLTPARRHFTSHRLWAGVAVAFLLALPNLLWQVTQGWPSLEFYRAQDMLKNVPTPPLDVLKMQLLAMNPGALPVWLAGLGFFFWMKEGRRYRHLGWIYVFMLALMLIGQKSRPDRIAAAYLILFAGGGVALGELARRAAWLRIALPSALVVLGLALAPIGLPLLPPQTTASYTAFLGVVPQIEKGEGKRSRLPQWIADRFSWPQLIDDVEAVFRALPEDEQRKAVIIGASYGQAAPLDVLGHRRGLPRTYSTHNSYYLWGPPPDPVEVAIVVGLGEAGPDGIRPDPVLKQLFSDIELAATHECEWCMNWRNDMPIWVVRQPKVALRDVWPELKRYR